MKILHVFNEIKFSGAEIMYATAASAFEKNGAKLAAISTGENVGSFAANFEKSGISVFHRPINFSSFSIKSFSYYYKFYQLLKKEKINILHIHRNDLYLPAFIAKIANVRCIKTQHSTFKNRWFTLPIPIIKRFILRRCLKVTFHTIGESVYKNELYYYKNPSIQINNWCDENKFFNPSSLLERKKIRKQLQIPLESFVVISTGSCTKNKNHSDIIKALQMVNKEFECYYIHLGNGELESNEKSLAQKFGISTQIRFLKNKKNVKPYLVAADCYIMPSHFEGLSIASIEAMACQLPLILYNSPGLRDLINNDDCGFLISRNYEEITLKIKLLANDPKLKLRMGTNGRKKMMQEYSMTANTKKIIDIYKNK